MSATATDEHNDNIYTEEQLLQSGWEFRQDEDSTWRGVNETLRMQTFFGYFVDKDACVYSAGNLQSAREQKMKPPGPLPALDRDPVAESLQEQELPLVELTSAVGESSQLIPATVWQPEQLVLFDYDSLPAEARIVVQNCATDIHSRIRNIRQDTIAIGARLKEAKEKLERGQWEAWLKAETPFSRDTADRLIQVAGFAAQSPQLAENFDRMERSAVYLLVAPATPQAAVVEASERAKAGEKITHVNAKEIVERHKPKKVVAAAGREQITKQPKRQSSAPVALPYTEEQLAASGWVVKQVGDNWQGINEKLSLDTSDGWLSRHGALYAAGNLQWQREQEMKPPAQDTIDESQLLEEREETASARLSVNEDWEQATIEIVIKLHKHDGNALGRMVQIGVRANEAVPTLTFPREHQVFDGQEAITWSPMAVFPAPIAEVINKVREQLPTQLAQAEARKKAEEEKVRLEAEKAAKKAEEVKAANEEAKRQKRAASKTAKKPAKTGGK